MYVCVSGCKKCSFFGKFGMLCFLETPILRLALLPYYPRIATCEPNWVNEKLSHTQKETITMQILCKMFQVTAWSDFLQRNDFGPNKDLEFLKLYSMFFEALLISLGHILNTIIWSVFRKSFTSRKICTDGILLRS